MVDDALHTSRGGVFARGDVVLGPTLVEAIAQGKRAALSISSFLQGEKFSEEKDLPAPLRYSLEQGKKAASKSEKASCRREG